MDDVDELLGGGHGGMRDAGFLGDEEIEELADGEIDGEIEELEASNGSSLDAMASGAEADGAEAFGEGPLNGAMRGEMSKAARADWATQALSAH